MRTVRVLFASALMASTAAVGFACGPKPKQPPKEPAVTETVTDAGLEGEAEAPPPKSLYERLGGKEGIAKFVDTLIKTIQADTKINKRFSKLQGKRLEDFKQKLVDQICKVAEGDCEYTGKSMKDAHKGMRVREEEWQAFISDVNGALMASGVSDDAKDDVIGLLAPMHDDVVESRPVKK